MKKEDASSDSNQMVNKNEGNEWEENKQAWERRNGW